MFVVVDVVRTTKGSTNRGAFVNLRRISRQVNREESNRRPLTKKSEQKPPTHLPTFLVFESVTVLTTEEGYCC